MWVNIALVLLAVLVLILYISAFTRKDKQPQIDDNSRNIKDLSAKLDDTIKGHLSDINNVKSSIQTINNDLQKYIDLYTMSVGDLCDGNVNPYEAYLCIKERMSKVPIQTNKDFVEIRSTYQPTDNTDYIFLSTFAPISKTNAPLVQVMHSGERGTLTRRSVASVADLKDDATNRWTSWV